MSEVVKKVVSKRYGKKYSNAISKVQLGKRYTVSEAFGLLAEISFAKFDESVDADIVLGIDAAKGEQTVRGSVILPHGTGRKMRVVVFARGESEEQAKKAGADEKTLASIADAYVSKEQQEGGFGLVCIVTGKQIGRAHV